MSMELENDGLERWFSFSRGPFSGSMLIFQGVVTGLCKSPQVDFASPPVYK